MIFVLLNFLHNNETSLEFCNKKQQHFIVPKCRIYVYFELEKITKDWLIKKKSDLLQRWGYLVPKLHQNTRKNHW